jgi:hypothetical protein
VTDQFTVDRKEYERRNRQRREGSRAKLVWDPRSGPWTPAEDAILLRDDITLAEVMVMLQRSERAIVNRTRLLFASQCFIEGCGAPQKARGLCPAHYCRLLINGDVNPDKLSRKQRRKLFEEGLRPCGTCKEIKELSAFSRDRSQSDGIETVCRPCSSLKSARLRIRQGLRKNSSYDYLANQAAKAAIAALLEQGLKKCFRCNEVKPVATDFYQYGAKIRPYCKPCYLLLYKKPPAASRVLRLERAERGVKWCNGCEQELPLSEFRVLSNGKPNSRCRPCQQLERATARVDPLTLENRELAKQGLRRCPDCQDALPLTLEFFPRIPNPNSPSRGICKPCERQRANERNRAKTETNILTPLLARIAAFHAGQPVDKPTGPEAVLLTRYYQETTGLKWCNGCCQALYPSEFMSTNLCRPCQQARHFAKRVAKDAEYLERKAARDAKAVLKAQGLKQCNDCGDVKPLTEYSKCRSNPDGRDQAKYISYCKPCVSIRNRKRHYKDRPDIDPRISQKRVKDTRPCMIEGCDTARVSRGMCNKHWRRWKTHGDPHYVRPEHVDKPCAVEGCGRRTIARGWCYAHWGRWKKDGDVRAHIPLKKQRNSEAPMKPP